MRIEGMSVAEYWEAVKKTRTGVVAYSKIMTPAENSEDESRRSRLFKEAIEGARNDARQMRMEREG